MKHNRLFNPWMPYFFLSPFLLIYAIFMVYPLTNSIHLSMHQTFGPGHSTFVFLGNFIDLFQDDLFWVSLVNTAKYTILSVAINIPISLFLALVLNLKWIKGRIYLRLVFFSPALVGTVFVAVMFGVIFQNRTGLLSVTLNKVTFMLTGGNYAFDLEFPWLQEYVMTSLIIASLWMYVGFNMIYFLAALQRIDQDLLDASRMDGAGPWDRFVHVIIPAIRPVSGFVLLMSVIASFQLFELPFLLFNGSGPDHQALTIVMYLYRNGFEIGDLGYASAIGWFLALILISLTLIQRLCFGSKEEA